MRYLHGLRLARLYQLLASGRDANTGLAGAGWAQAHGWPMPIALPGGLLWQPPCWRLLSLLRHVCYLRRADGVQLHVVQLADTVDLAR